MTGREMVTLISCHLVTWNESHDGYLANVNTTNFGQKTIFILFCLILFLKYKFSLSHDLHPSDHDTGAT